LFFGMSVQKNAGSNPEQASKLQFNAISIWPINNNDQQ